MSIITVNSNKLVLVFRSNEFVKVLKTGRTMINFFDDLELIERGKAFTSRYNLDLLLKYVDIRAELDVFDVQDNEFAILYKDGKFESVLGVGRHAYVKGIYTFTIQRANLNQLELGTEIDRNLIEKGFLNGYLRSVKVEIFEKAILYLDGKQDRILDAGTYYFYKNAITVHVAKTDMRRQNMEVNGQEILTRDKAQIRINFVVQYQVIDIVKALEENKDFDKQLYALLQLALREYVGQMSLDELMDNKESITAKVLETVSAQVENLGLTLFNAGVKDIILNGEMRDIMNQVLVAEKRAQANIIMRREETASMRSLLNTAKLMEENATLYKLKEMEYVEKIAEKINNINLSGNGQLIEQLKQIFVK